MCNLGAPSIFGTCMILWRSYAKQAEGIQITRMKKFGTLDKTQPNTEYIPIIRHDGA